MVSWQHYSLLLLLFYSLFLQILQLLFFQQPLFLNPYTIDCPVADDPCRC